MTSILSDTSCTLSLATVDLMCRNALYVRPFYGRLFEMLVKKRNVLLTSTPGIGKVGIPQST